MKKSIWLVVALVAAVLLLAVFFGGWGYRGGCWGWSNYSGWGMMGPGMMGWGYSPLGWIGMIFIWLIPVGFIVLTVLGVAWLVRTLSGSTPPSSGRTCPNCGRGAQADWQNCPYCGTALK